MVKKPNLDDLDGDIDSIGTKLGDLVEAEIDKAKDRMPGCEHILRAQGHNSEQMQELLIAATSVVKPRVLRKLIEVIYINGFVAGTLDITRDGGAIHKKITETAAENKKVTDAQVGTKKHVGNDSILAMFGFGDKPKDDTKKRSSEDEDA